MEKNQRSYSALGVAKANEILAPALEVARDEARDKSYRVYLKNLGELWLLSNVSSAEIQGKLSTNLQEITETSRIVIDGNLDSVTAKLIYDGLNARILALLLAHSPVPAKVKQ